MLKTKIDDITWVLFKHMKSEPNCFRSTFKWSKTVGVDYNITKKSLAFLECIGLVMKNEKEYGVPIGNEI